MIDLKILRQNPGLVARTIANKAVRVDLDRAIALDAERSEMKKRSDDLRAERNRLSDSMGKGKPDPELIVKSKALKEELQALETDFEAVDAEFLELYKKIPNIPTDDTPIGLSEDENVVVRTWGEPTKFAFEPRNHYQIAEARGWIDKERATKVAGARFAYLKGDLVKLQLALVSWVMDRLSDTEFIAGIIGKEGFSVSSRPFTPVLPPYMIRTAPYDAMDRLEPREDRYKIEGEDLWLQGSAEHVLGSMHSDEIFEEAEMPVRYVGYATSFRKEAGTYGKDMEGIIRMHQFDKLEMESFSTKETSHEEHLLFSAIQERFMQLLGIPYRKLQKCTFDIGKPNAKGSDIEAWLPGQGKYRETHTADYMTDYQSRRLQTRVRRSDGDVELVHTNDATAFACGRALVAIIENFQNADMTVRVPEALRPYLGGKTAI